MEIKDIIFEPHNDAGADDLTLVTQHKNLISKSSFGDATTLLDSNNYSKGFRASLFNSIQNQIRRLQIYLLNQYAAESNELYSFTEPTEAQMDGKDFWIQPLDN